MAKSRKEYYRKTRKNRMRELKHSRAGWCSMISALTAAALFVVSATLSFLAAGEAEFIAGTISLMGLILAAGALVLGVMGMRESKVRPIPPRTGMILGLIMTVVLGGLYAGGIIY